MVLAQFCVEKRRTCNTIKISLDDSFFPLDAMPTIRPNLPRSPLTLDEQSFEGLLSAAFTIQEHNEQRRRATQIVESEVPSEPESLPGPSGKCPHCSGPKLDEAARCENCGLDEFRPGERLQRNWASMWLKSQEQGLWPERSSQAGETIRMRTIGEGARQDSPIASGTSRVQPESDYRESARAQTDPQSVLGGASEKERWRAEAREIIVTESPAPGTIENGGAKLDDRPAELYVDEEFNGPEATEAPIDSDSGTASDSMMQRLADIEVTLRFHRADLYLGLAVFVALLALLWPGSSAPRRASLSPWERALVTMGIAEAPAPSIHLQGDPSIEVWVDPHTALYYCPGAEPYGKTTDGRLSSQREAQLDRFEPAGRSVCE